MGSYCPVPGFERRAIDAAMATVVEPVLAELRGRDIDFRGVLYAGLMVTPTGAKVLEFNVRFGDPETQAVLRASRATSWSCAPPRPPASSPRDGGLKPQDCVTVSWPPPATGEQPHGRRDHGPGRGRRPDDVTVFHAGTALRDGQSSPPADACSP